jgi:hypothetical protein
VWCALAKIYEEKSDCKTTWCALAKIYNSISYTDRSS